MPLSLIILILHAAATLAMTGLIWFVQIVHYPLFDQVGVDAFAAYEHGHNQLTTYVVAPLMLIEAVAASLIAFRLGVRVSPPLAWIGLSLVVVIWIGTIALSVPQHRILMNGFDVAAHRRLVETNWIRTVAWTLRAMIALWVLALWSPQGES